MALRKVRLQAQGLICVKTRFVAASRYRVGAVIQPALHHGETGKSKRKIWVELDGLFEKGLGLYRCVVEQIHLRGVIVRLDVEKIGIWILCRSAIEPRFFVRGKFRLQRRRNFLRQISLNSKNVC